MRKLQRFSIAIIVAALSASCALVRVNPNQSEAQQARAAAIQIFQAVEMAGIALEQVQITEIQMFDAGRIEREPHRVFQSRLLVTARIVRTGLKQIQSATSKPELKNTVNLILEDLKHLRDDFLTPFPPAVGAGLNTLISSLSIVLLIL